MCVKEEQDAAAALPDSMVLNGQADSRESSLPRESERTPPMEEGEEESLPMTAAVTVEPATPTADDEEEGELGNPVAKEFRAQLKLDIEKQALAPTQVGVLGCRLRKIF